MRKLNLNTLFSQRDGRWGNILLGFNTNPSYNIANYGCLVTCLAMISNYYGKGDNPLTINEKIKQVNGFVSGGNYVWGSLTKFYGDIQEKLTNTPQKLTDAQINEIKQAIDAGYPVMFQIDFNPETAPTDMHYVLCVGYDESDENNFQIADPWTGQIHSLKDYLRGTRPSARITIEQYIIYQGPVPKPGDYFLGIDLNNKESVKICVQAWKDLIDGKYVKKEDYEKLKAEKGNYDSLMTEKNSLAVQLQECQRQASIYKAEYDNATKEGGYIDQISYLEEAKKNLQNEISELNRQVGYWTTKYNNLKKPGLKFIQDAVIRLCEKMGVDLK
jgi:hypothetical protein